VFLSTRTDEHWGGEMDAVTVRVAAHDRHTLPRELAQRPGGDVRARARHQHQAVLQIGLRENEGLLPRGMLPAFGKLRY
jgi:hypothetical protein